MTARRRTQNATKTKKKEGESKARNEVIISSLDKNHKT
jgi:hypothetical protein